MEKNLYDILGVSKNATQDELKKQYRKLSKQYHPDMQSGKTDAQKKEAEEKFKEINAAYATLSDESKRRQYDQFGSVDGNGPFGNGGEGFDPFSFFRSHFGGNPFGNDFGFSGFGGVHSETSSMDSPEDGSDVLAKMTMSFKDMVHGTVKEFDIDKTIPCSYCDGKGIEKGTTATTCPKCNGEGHIVHTMRQGFMMSQTIQECPECHGTGKKMTICSHCHGDKRIHSKQHISVKIPQGIASSQRLRVAKAGECGVKGGKDGDLYVQVFVEDCPNNALKRISQLDLQMEYPIDPITASFGGEVEVKTLWGSEKVNIPQNSHDGSVLKIPRQGLKSNSGIGDMFLKLHIAPFTSLSQQQKDILMQLKLSKSNISGLDKLENDMFLLSK